MADFEDYNEMCQSILYKDFITNGLSTITKTADGSQFAYIHLDLKGHGFTNIEKLKDYEHLQKLDISYNQLSDLSVLCHLKNLLELNAAHNDLRDLLAITPLPRNLRHVDYGHNLLTSIPQLTDCYSIVTLLLDENEIREICGLKNLKCLKTLSLSKNQITQIKGLENLPLTTLNISHNELVKIEGLSTLSKLQVLDLSSNRIRSLDGLQLNLFLEKLNLEDNEIIDLNEIEFLNKLSLLRQLNLRVNPIQELPDSRISIIYHLNKLSDLDDKAITISEKVSAKTLLNPTLETIAARDHVMHIVYSFLQPSYVHESTLASDTTPYPMLVLVGPDGMWKHVLILKLVEEFPDYFGIGLSHTTRPKRAEDDDSHHFISFTQFEKDIKQINVAHPDHQGKFLQTYADYEGHMYGIQTQTIDEIAGESLACIFQMQLEGVLSLKLKHFEPRYVLLLPECSQKHERRLFTSGCYGDADIADILMQTSRYADYHRDHAGFFDMCISSDDVTECYKLLRRLVMDYLGLDNIVLPLTPSASSDFERSTASGFTMDKDSTVEPGTPSSRNVGRTWNKSFSNYDSIDQPPIEQELSFIEIESNNRRRKNASNLITGNLESREILKIQNVLLRSMSAPTDYNMLPMESPDSSEMLSEVQPPSQDSSPRTMCDNFTENYL